MITRGDTREQAIETMIAVLSAARIEGVATTIPLHLAVLASGMVPNAPSMRLPFELGRDEFGFLEGGTEGIYAAGCVKQPCDVARTTKDATATALKAIQCLCNEA